MQRAIPYIPYLCGGPDIPWGPPRLVKVLVALVVALAISCAPGFGASAWAADEDATLTDEGSALDADAGFGINGFTRYMRGASREVAGEDVGYRFPLPKGASLVALATDAGVIVHVDADAAEAAGLDLADEEDQSALRAMVEELDEAASRGGELMRDIDAWSFTTENEVVGGVFRFRFDVEGDGRRYVAVVPADLAEGALPTKAAEATGIDLSQGVLWCDGAELVAADAVAIHAAPSVFDELAGFFSSVDLRPLSVSLKTSAVALVVTFVLGLVAAWRALRTSGRLKGVLDSVFTIPMVLPPTVCGFLLLLLFGQSTPVGRFLIDHGVSLVFSWPAAVISAIVVSFPLMYRTALGAFESLDAQMLDAARTLGWSEGRIFRSLMLPLAWPSIAAGTVLAFARAMGEFGCTLFFAGNYAGVTQTIPIAIYFEWMSGDTDVALFWVIVVIALSFAVILFINLYTARSQRYRERGGAPRHGILGRRRAAARAMSSGASGERAGADTLDEHGGDALRIDQEALRELVAGDARERRG